MLHIDPNFDLELLSEHFTECGDYTKEVILEELKYWQSMPDFLCLLSVPMSPFDEGRWVSGCLEFHVDVVNGFLIGYRNRNSLWISQVWRRSDGNLSISRDALVMAGDWARERGMDSITGETKRNEMAAMGRHGFTEISINMRLKL